MGREGEVRERAGRWAHTVYTEGDDFSTTNSICIPRLCVGPTVTCTGASVSWRNRPADRGFDPSAYIYAKQPGRYAMFRFVLPCTYIVYTVYIYIVR